MKLALLKTADRNISHPVNLLINQSLLLRVVIVKSHIDCIFSALLYVVFVEIS